MAYIDYGAWDGHDSNGSWTEAVDRLLNESQARQRDRFVDELDRIDDQLTERDVIHAEIVDDLEWTIGRYTDRLEQLYRSRSGTQNEERTRLKDRIATLQQRLRDEHREHWRDRQDLEQERRDILHELGELEDTDLLELL